MRTTKGGSSNSSLVTSFQVFSSAAGSPGEHGVYLTTACRSSLLTFTLKVLKKAFQRGAVPLSFEDGIVQVTFLKCVALSTFRTGCIRASLTTTAISDPEYLEAISSAHFRPRTDVGQRDRAKGHSPVRCLAQRPVVLLRQLARCCADVELKYPFPSI